MEGIRWAGLGVLLTAWLLAAAAPTPVSAQTAQTAERLGESRRLARESLAAYRASDFTTFGVKNDSALALRPGHPTLVYNRAAARALANDTAGSVQSLSHLAAWGLAYDPAADTDFETLRGAPAFEAIRDSLLGNGRPRGTADRAVVLADSAMIPEGLAYDPPTESFIVSGVRHRIVLRVSRDGGSVSRVVDGADTGMLPPLGLAIDPARRSLWLSGTLVEESVELAGEENGPGAEVREYGLDSGDLRRVVAVPDGSVATGDLAVAPDGSVLVSDWRGGALLRAVSGSDTLQEILPPGTLSSPQGIVPLNDGSGAWVADYGLGLVFVDFRDGSVDVVRSWTTLLGSDGLVAFGDDLLIVQNGVAPARVLHVRLSDDRRHAEEVSVLLSAHSDFSDPTGITVVEGVPYVIANGQWPKFAGGEVRSAELARPIVLRLESEEANRGPAAGQETAPANATERTSDSLRVTIYRDAWGVPHVYGPTDASVVFGGAFAQAEDNWPQVEENFARAIGRGAELDGEDALLDDYLAHGLEIPRRSMEEYERAPEELRRLYDAFAAGFNHYLDTHPEAERRLLERVEPWYTLALIRFKYHHNEYLGYAGLQRAHSLRALRRARVAESGERVGAALTVPDVPPPDLPSRAWPSGTVSPDGERALGSNQWAVAGSRTRSGHPMLLINPHVSFFGMSTYTETHLASAEGLEFSGLTRFGFMLPYMGNNAHLGWAYTDNYGDHGDLYLVDLDEDEATYRYGDGRRDLTTWATTIRVRTETGVEPREYRFAKTHQGPILGFTSDGQPLAVRLAKLDEGGWFEQWYGMMRADSLEEWRAAAALLNVPYMNTMYADRDGNILYIYNHAIPRRSTDYDWSEPVDGSDPGTEWDGYHALDELPQFLNPESGYLQNTNSTPFTATEGITIGPDDFPLYMIGRESDNRRAQNSRRVLGALSDLTLDDFAEAVLTTRLIAADEWLPDLFDAFEALEAADPDRAAGLAGPIAALRGWNREADTASVATTLFVAWSAAANPDRAPAGADSDARPATDRWLKALENVLERLESGWGTWEVRWGQINRIQRPDAAGELPFSDTLPSLPVAGAPGWLGPIFVFHAEPADEGKRLYGRHGNSFVKIVEFTPEVSARSVFVFGQSGAPASPHYFDQAILYSEQRFKPAWFSAPDVEANATRTYAVEIPPAGN